MHVSKNRSLLVKLKITGAVKLLWDITAVTVRVTVKPVSYALTFEASSYGFKPTLLD